MIKLQKLWKKINVKLEEVISGVVLILIVILLAGYCVYFWNETHEKRLTVYLKE